MAEKRKIRAEVEIDTRNANKNVKDLNNEMNNLKDSMSVNNIASNGLGGTLKNLANGFKALTKTAWSFVATPVGAIITAIVVAATALYNIFKTFKPVTDRIEQAFSAISAVGNTLKNTFIGLFTGTKSLKESFSGLGKSMSDAAKEAAALTKAEQDLEDQQKNLEITNKQAEAQINKLLVQSKNRTLSEKERQKLIEDALALERKQFEENKKVADQEYEIALQRLFNSKRLTEQQKQDVRERGILAAFELQDVVDISDAEIERLKIATEKKIEIQNKSTQLQEKAQNRLDQLADKAAEDEQKRIDKAEKDRQDAIDKALKENEDAYKKELTAFKTSLLEQGRTKAEIDSAIEQKEIDHLLSLIEIRKKYGQDILDLEQQLVDKRIGIADKYTKNITDITKKITDETKKQEEDLDAFFEEQLQSQIDYNQEVTDKGYDAGVKQLDKDLELEKLKQDKKIEFARNTASTINQIDEQATQFRKNLLANQLKNGEISQREYDKKIAKIEKDAANRKKAFAIAETIINTAATIMGIWKDFPKKDFGVTATIMSVAAGILGAAQIATIASTPVDGSSVGSGSVNTSMPSGAGGTAPTTSFTFADTPKTTEQPVVKTYVVSKDIETAQQLEKQTIANGTI